ncbi:MAG: type II toxin-antitoxin system Phd/YefM family antitoxin [Anaerolineales bacterium]|nr:MAG: type II toxin-antitoxin system Phd/YefM family antitoxin [Anaerolineales bacterium]
MPCKLKSEAVYGIISTIRTTRPNCERWTMGTVTISLTEVKKSLGEVVNRAAYGGERIVLASRGKPKAALISIEDLKLLESLVSEQALRRARRREALAEADTLREVILARRGGVPLPDSVEDLRQLREERIRDIAPDLR